MKSSAICEQFGVNRPERRHLLSGGGAEHADKLSKAASDLHRSAPASFDKTFTFRLFRVKGQLQCHWNRRAGESPSL
jgi:hypothetical protein